MVSGRIIVTTLLVFAAVHYARCQGPPPPPGILETVDLAQLGRVSHGVASSASETARNAHRDFSGYVHKIRDGIRKHIGHRVHWPRHGGHGPAIVHHLFGHHHGGPSAALAAAGPAEGILNTAFPFKRSIQELKNRLI